MPKQSTKRNSKSSSNNSSAVHSLPDRGRALSSWLVAVVLALAIGAVYGPAIDAPFIFDDESAVVTNQSIVSLWPLIGTSKKSGPLNPPNDLPTSGRPLVNLSLAINYQIGGLRPIGYHVFSVVVHFCSAMLVWAITRRTLRLPYFRGMFDALAGWLALAVALLWELHPLQTEAVAYVSQRSELMMAMFYLATVYCSLRYWSLLPLAPGEDWGEGDSQSRAKWLVLAVLACLCGMASKEVMVSAPLMMLLFERTFITGSLTKALRRSWPLYVGLAATWILLLSLCLELPRANSTGFGHHVTAYDWWLTQTKAIVMYLKLVVWPRPLLIHYEWPYLSTFTQSWIYVVPLLFLTIGTLVLFWRNHPVGYLGTWFFAILSATSVIPIVTEVAAERRMYLPLAALVVLFVVGGYLLCRHMSRQRANDPQGFVGLGLSSVAVASAMLLLALGFGTMSAKRLDTYHRPLDLWQEVLVVQPENHLAHENMGHQFEQKGNILAAMNHYREAIRLKPDKAASHNSLGLLLLETKAYPQAIAEFKEAIRIEPNDRGARANLSTALFASGNAEQALAELRAIRDLEQDDWAIHANLAMALQQTGKYSESIDSIQRALEINPNELAIYSEMAHSFALLNQREKAIATLEHGLALARASGDAASTELRSAQLNKIR